MGIYHLPVATRSKPCRSPSPRAAFRERLETRDGGNAFICLVALGGARPRLLTLNESRGLVCSLRFAPLLVRLGSPNSPHKQLTIACTTACGLNLFYTQAEYLVSYDLIIFI